MPHKLYLAKMTHFKIKFLITGRSVDKNVSFIVPGDIELAHRHKLLDARPR